MPDDVILDPLHMAAAISLTSPVQDAVMCAISAEARHPVETMIELSRYVIQALGMPQIEAQAGRIACGEIPAPPEVLAWYRRRKY
jgi:hypothetical protein